MELVSGSHSLGQNLYHLEWCPNYRYNIFRGKKIKKLCEDILHEVAHGWVAYRLGDDTARRAGRLTLDPSVHLDPLGTLGFLVTGMGWAKRVDVEPTRFQHPTWYLILARCAGPFANFLMANVAASIVWLLHTLSIDARVFMMVLAVNLTVAVYNLLPLPPLAGGAVVSARYTSSKDAPALSFIPVLSIVRLPVCSQLSIAPAMAISSLPVGIMT
jgi:Zn-dependent protease